MNLTFLGAAHEVTGSCFMLNACGKNIIIDCGLEQGPDYYLNQDIPVSPGLIDCVFLTHAHIDHSGKLPLLYATGFRGPIYSTTATADLCDIMLRDSAHIQEFEAEWRNRKGKRSGAEPFVPLYTMEDAIGAIKKFVPCSYREKIEVFPGISIRFTDVGHLLGSASIEVFISEDDTEKLVVFSGDIGNLNQPIIKDPQYLTKADYVVMESTYGDRSHGERPDYVKELSHIIQTTFDRGGNVVIPSFAVGRTQEMLYFLRKIKADGLVKGHRNFSVYVDSPLANEATNVFQENEGCCYDAETLELIHNGINPIGFDGLKVSITSDDSKNINFDNECKVIISASGMCEAGRIKHHLKHNLWRQECTILFVGYQAHGTLGRSLIEGSKTVKLFGEPIEVKAEIAQLSGISGHADNNGLMTWAKSFSPSPTRFFVVHGEDSVCELFAGRLRDELGATAVTPFSGDAWDLARDVLVVQGSRKKAQKKHEYEGEKSKSPAFKRLLAAGERLLAVIRRNEGGANKDLAKFADQINSLTDKWER